MRALLGVRPAGPAGATVVGLIHLDRIRPVRCRPARPATAPDATPHGTRRGARHGRRYALWVVLLCLDAVLSWTPPAAHPPPVSQATPVPAAPAGA